MPEPTTHVITGASGYCHHRMHARLVALAVGAALAAVGLAAVPVPAHATGTLTRGRTTQAGAGPGMVRIPGDAPLGLPAHALRAPSAAEQSQPLTITVVLKPTNQAGFNNYMREVYDRSSPLHDHFLTQAQLADRFGPSPSEYGQVRAWLVSQGLTVTQASANRLSLSVRGTRAAAERAFDTPIQDYSVGKRTMYANVDAPAVPGTLASDVQAVIGLSNRSQPAAPRTVQSVVQENPCLVLLADLGALSRLALIGGPALGEFLLTVPGILAATLVAVPLMFLAFNCYLQWSNNSSVHRSAQVSAANGRAQASATAPAQKIGLLEFDTYRPSDVSDWLNLLGVDPSKSPASRLSEVNVNGGVASPGPGESEVLLDIDSVLGLAPSAPTSYVVYDAPPSTGFVPMFQAMIADGDTVISNSWSQCEDQVPPAEAQAIDSVLASAAASGITVVNASGDEGSACFDGSPNTVSVPADSPNATAVGGTSPTFGPGFTYGHESWWNDQNADPPGGAGGFGVSRYFTRPAYQDGLTGASMRSVPDLSFNAEPLAGIELCQADAGGCPQEGVMWGGTSLAAPEVAAEVADLNLALGHNVGNLNDALHPLAGTDAFHSPQSMSSDFAHVGLGSPDFTTIYQQLTGTSTGAVSASQSVAFSLGQPQADGSQQGLVRVDLEDANGFPVGGKTVTLTANAGSGAVVSPSSVTTDPTDGAAVFTVTDTRTETVTFTATDTTDGMTLTTQPTLTFVPPVAAGAAIYGGPPTVPNDGTSQATIYVYLEDARGRPAPGKTVALSQGGDHAVITPAGSSTPGTTAVTDSTGTATFYATDTNAESVDFTATDVTDGNLPVPGSLVVNFAPGSATCPTALPTAASGYSVSPFATGFAYNTESILPPQGFGFTACLGEQSVPAFDSSGNAYVSDTLDGTIHVLGPSGGTPSTANQLPDADFPAGSLGYQLAFGTDGSLYTGLDFRTNGSAFNPEIVQLDPSTGAIIKVVASAATGLHGCPIALAVDPLSGDLFTDDPCSGAVASSQISRIHDPAGPNPTVSDYVTTGGQNSGMAFAPDGTLYLAHYTNGANEVDAIGGTNTANPTVTKVASVSSADGVAVTGVNSSGHATSLEVFGPNGDVTAVDLTQSPAATTTIATGTSGFFFNAVSANGCAYGSIAGTIVRVGPTSCSSTSSTSPEITLQENGSSTPATGSAVSVTASLQNVASPSGTPVHFTITGPNPGAQLADADGSGQATVSYAGVFQGVDTVTASAVIDGNVITSAPVQVHWTAGKDTSFLDLNTSQLGGPVGAPATLTASLVDVTQSPPAPIAGATVTLGLSGQTCTAQTSASGVASCQLTPQSPGLLQLTASYAGNPQYTASSASSLFDATVAVSSSQMISFTSAAPSNADYGGPSYTVAATASSGLPVTLSIDPSATSVCSISGSTVSFIGVGTCVIDANQAGNSNYSPAPQVQQSFSVAPAPVHVDANPASKTYGDSDPAPSATLRASDFKFGDTAGTSGITGSASCSIASHSENVGTYTGVISCSPGTLSAANYTFVAGNTADLTISQATLTVTADDKAITYGDSLPTFTYQVTGFKASDTSAILSGNASCGVSGTSGSPPGPAGSYAITCAQGTLSAGSNYTFSFAGGTLLIIKKPATLGYTGGMFFSTGSASATTATVTLQATLTPAAGGSPNLTKAAPVTFLLYKSTNLTMATPDQTCTATSVSSAGITSCTLSSLGLDNWTVIVQEPGTNGDFTAPDSDPAVVTVYQPAADKFATGGGWVTDPSPAVSAQNKHGNFGLTVRYKSGTTTPAGQSVYVFRGTDGYDYVIKSNSWTGGGLSFGTTTASFSGKANVTAIDPKTGLPVSGIGGGNYTYRVDVTDNGSTGDTYAISVYTPTGKLYHQAGTTGSQLPLGGGNIVVHTK